MWQIPKLSSSTPSLSILVPFSVSDPVFIPTAVPVPALFPSSILPSFPSPPPFPFASGVVLSFPLPLPRPVPVPVLPSFYRLLPRSRSGSSSMLITVPILVPVPVPFPSPFPPPFAPPRPFLLLPVPRTSFPPRYDARVQTPGLAAEADGCPQALPIVCRDDDACGMKVPAVYSTCALPV